MTLKIVIKLQRKSTKKDKITRKKSTKWQKGIPIYTNTVASAVNGLNDLIKRQNEQISTKTRSTYMLPKEIHFRAKGTYGLKVKGQGKVFHANRNQKKARVIYLYQTNQT